MNSHFTISRRHMIGAIGTLPFASSRLLAATSKISRIMVQGRPQQTESPYKFAAIMAALDKLGGVRKMRCRDPYTGTAGWNTYVNLARQGVMFSFTLSIREVSRTVSDLKAFLAAAPGSIWAIEGPNEPDLNPVTYNGVTDSRMGFRTGNAPALMAYMRNITAALGVDPQLRSIPIIACNDYMQAEQAPFTTLANSHIYPKPTWDIPSRLAAFNSLVVRSKHAQGVITEWGRTTGGGSANVTSPPVTLSQQADLLSSDIALALAQTSVRTFSIYELFSWGGTSEMNNFGIFNPDGSERPAVAAIRAVIA